VHLCPQTGKPTPDFNSTGNGQKRVYFDQRAKQAAWVTRKLSKNREVMNAQRYRSRNILRAKRRLLGLCIDCGVKTNHSRCEDCYERTER
jgi:hypothetical protein